MIRTESLSFKYPDGTHALSNVTLEIRTGEFVSILGANGCGKTTLIKHFNGLLKPTSGSVFLEDCNLRSFKSTDVFQRVGMVFQDPNDQLFASSVAQDVAFGPRNLGMNPDDASKYSAEALEWVGMQDLAKKSIHALSFGQKRRVAIAGVLAMRPRMILLDEPTSGLDPKGCSSVIKLLRKLNTDKGITMVMATHDVDLVPLVSHRLIVMNQGRIAGDGTPGEVLADTTMIRAVKLRLPRVNHLAEIMQRRDGLCFESLPLTIGQARQELLRIVEKNHRE